MKRETGLEMGFYVREANLGDLERLVGFILAEAREAEGGRKSGETVRRGIEAGLKNPAMAQYWVLVSGEAGVIGSVSVVREWSDWHAGYYWWIQSMFISPEYRGQNLMKLLLEVVREEARQAKAIELRLYVHRENVRAIRAYRREGFLDAPYRVMGMEL